jgi:hypothetical protein
MRKSGAPFLIKLPPKYSTEVTWGQVITHLLIWAIRAQYRSSNLYREKKNSSHSSLSIQSVSIEFESKRRILSNGQVDFITRIKVVWVQWWHATNITTGVLQWWHATNTRSPISIFRLVGLLVWYSNCIINPFCGVYCASPKEPWVFSHFWSKLFRC